MTTPAHPKIQFVGHYAGRTGAPLLLLGLLKWIHQHSAAHTRLHLKMGGDLLAEFREVTETSLEGSEAHSGHRGVFHRMRARLLSPSKRFSVFRGSEADLLYVNTVVPLAEMEAAVQEGIPVVCNAHELTTGIKIWTDSHRFSKIAPRITRFIAASEAVKSDLVADFGVDSSRVVVIHEFMTSESLSEERLGENRHRIRKELNIQEGEIVVGMCGTFDWRKGSDLFVQMAARLLADKSARFRFLWVGGKLDKFAQIQLTHDLERIDAVDRWIHIKETATPMPYFSAMDIFTLTSRSDCFPVAMLEAAHVGLPLVAFSAAGGGGEFITREVGRLIPYLRADLMAEAVLELARNELLRKQLGAFGRQKVAAKYLPSQICPRIWREIQSIVHSKCG